MLLGLCIVTAPQLLFGSSGEDSLLEMLSGYVCNDNVVCVCVGGEMEIEKMRREVRREDREQR